MDDSTKHSYHYDIDYSTRHPYHLHHPVTFTTRSEPETQSLGNEAEPIVYEAIDYEAMSKIDWRSSSNFDPEDACDWCGKELGDCFYQCLVCGFKLDMSCIEKDPPLIITNPKSHQHPLNIFPRPLPLPCSACGLGDKTEETSYVCLECNYFVHESCIDLPRVIKLTRHPHRLSYTPCLPPPAKRSCGVCHRTIDVKFGMYSCNKGCPYAIHSKCATHEDIWDGIDLEGVPEEPIEDVSPFEEVGYNLIKHFSHGHDLRFHEDGVDHDAIQECQACCRSIDAGGFYCCTILHCDFLLHEPCANFPKKKEHPVHRHPLVLHPKLSYDCSACDRTCSGFSYICSTEYCSAEYYNAGFKMDVRCASICEPFKHKVHPHPLFLFSGRDELSLCGICDIEGKNIFTLKCIDCEFSMCFKCATIPVEIPYKHDKHVLTLCGGQDSSDSYWCERCERQIDPKKWFYTCDECCTTLHVDCLFGDSSYIKIGWGFDVEIKGTFNSNNGNSRPLCDQCGARCLYTGFFKGEKFCLCSLKCFFLHVNELDEHQRYS